jgi:uncharacterized protein YegP (UPF0339 family)
MAEAKVELYRDSSAKAEWRWRVRAANGKVVSDSAEGYSSHAHCLRMAEELNPGLRVVQR